MTFEKNIYDIRKDNQLLYVCPMKQTKYCISDKKASRIAVIVNLYYADDLEWYLGYLKNIPDRIHIYIFSSNTEIIKWLKDFQRKSKDITVMQKANRGRDISALLVAFRSLNRNYEYICFLHDKKPIHKYLQNDTEIWKRNLWENMIGSSEYIFNILEIFEENEKIGLLVPPERMGEHMTSWCDDKVWGSDFDNCRELAKKFELNCNLTRSKPPITLGTVFWARTKCLQKLWDEEWDYEDFPEEPVPIDGTISHAIERILGYVAQDAGYLTGTVMTNSYAEWFFLFLQDSMRGMYRLIEQKLGIHSLYRINHKEEKRKELEHFFKRYSEVYIYGAGKWGEEMLSQIREDGLTPKGFVVSIRENQKNDICGMRILELSEIPVSKNIGFVVAVNYELQEEIERLLLSRGYMNYMFGY